MPCAVRCFTCVNSFSPLSNPVRGILVSHLAPGDTVVSATDKIPCLCENYLIVE